MKKTSSKVIGITNLLALLLCVVVAILVPLGYLILAYQYQTAVLQTEVIAEANEATEMIGQNPEYWRFEQHRLDEFLSERPLHNAEIRRILGMDGSVIAQSVDDIQKPYISRSHDLFDSGTKVGSIEIVSSLRSILVNVMLLLALGLFIGGGMFLYLRKFPLAALGQALKSLQQSEEKFRAMASTAADAIIVMDGKGEIAYWNSAAEKMFGYSIEEVQGRALHNLIAPERYRDAFSRGFKKFRRSGQGPAIGSMLEFNAVRKDGSEFPIEVATSAIAVSDEWQAVGIVRNITERKKTEQHLIRLEKLESLGVLAGGIAHDFNNLLTVMMGNVSLAMLDTDRGSEIYKRLISMGEAAHRAQNLTRQLLTFAKGGAPIKKTIMLQPLIEEACRFSLSGSHVKCKFSFADDLMPVDVDPGQVGQVLHNLILNGCQAMPAGGTITVNAENVHVGRENKLALASGRYVRVSVRDEGAGIPENIIAKIFDPFFTTKDKGSGLGLATSYSIIKRHGGHLAAESAEGRGALFLFYLPASTKKPTSGSPLDKETANGKGRILIMDDETAFRAVVGEILKAIGYDYELAKDGDEAIELYRAARESGRPFDAAILDLTVPGGMGGKEAVQRLIAIDPKVRAIVASGYSNDPVMADFKSYGFVGVIEKPFDLHTLSRTLQAVTPSSVPGTP